MSVSAICSASPTGTRGSLVPWMMKRGDLMRSALLLGDMLSRNSLSFSGSPYSATLSFRLHGPVFFRKVTKFEIPTMSTPAAHIPGFE